MIFKISSKIVKFYRRLLFIFNTYRFVLGITYNVLAFGTVMDFGA